MKAAAEDPFARTLALFERVAADDASLPADLSLQDSDLDDALVEVLAESLKRNGHVESVDLRWNRGVTDAGARALLFMLRENGTLRRVTLAEDGGAGTSDTRYASLKRMTAFVQRILCCASS